MITFQVNDMTCAHCAATITRAVASVDPHARTDIQVDRKLVQVTSTATPAALAAAIEDAGYTPHEIRNGKD